jgi:hypothetical protein
MAEAKSIAIPPRVKDLTGHPPFGRLTVVAFAGIARNRKATWRCLCDCGNETVVRGTGLVSGSSQSCGCLGREKSTTHGMSRTPEYNCWVTMLQRCFNPSDDDYVRYGLRGITVCERWRTSFEAFFADMGLKPIGHDISIERQDNNGNYEKGNCYWASRTQQARNRRSSRLLTFNGRTQCVASWAEERGLHLKTLYTRLHRGWSVERALGMPAAK